MEQQFVREIEFNYRQPKIAERVFINGPERASSFIRSVLPNNVQEHFVVLILDGAHTIVSYKIVSSGTANSCQVHPREVFQPAILAGAVAIIVAHNHPSGALDISKEDIAMTNRIKEAGNILGVKILDSLVITEEGFKSIIEA